MKILVATKNPAKAKEMKKFLGEGFDLVTLMDLSNAPDIEETGKTFEENTVLKAKTYFEWLKIQGSPLYKGDPCIGCVTDDGGLEIDFLNGEPGILSRRWPGYEATDQELIDIALEKLKGVPKEKRTARLRTVGAYYDGKNILTETASIDGYIIEKQEKECEPGYPFRTIFMVSEFNKLYQDLSHEEHEQVNHRKKVFFQLGRRISS